MFRAHRGAPEGSRPTAIAGRLRTWHLVATAALVAHAPGGAAWADRTPVGIVDTTERVAPDSGTDTLLVRRITFADVVHTAVYDSATAMLFVSTGSESKPAGGGQGIAGSLVVTQIAAYDLESRRVAWRRTEEGVPSAVLGDRLMLESEKRPSLVLIRDGEPAGEAEPNNFEMAHEGIMLGVDDHVVIARDLTTGMVRWRADRGDVVGPVTLVPHRSKLVVGAEGVQVLDSRDGTGWTYPMAASRRDLFRVGGDGGHVNANTLGGLLGGKKVRSMSSAPLVRDGRVYFAAETSVVCLDLDTGRCLWKSDLRRTHGFSFRERALGLPGTGEFLGRMLVGDAGDRLTVASLGWAPGKDHTWWADPPTIALLAKSDGRVIRRIQVEGIRVLIDVRTTARGYFLLAPDRVIALDESLAVRRVIRPRADLFELLGWLPCRDPVAVATAGLAAIDADTLGFSWVKKMGVRDTRSDAPEPWLQGEAVDPGSAWQADTTAARWVISTTALTRIDPATCRPAATWPISGMRSAYFEGRSVVGTAGRTVTLVSLPKP